MPGVSPAGVRVAGEAGADIPGFLLAIKAQRLDSIFSCTLHLVVAE